MNSTGVTRKSRAEQVLIKDELLRQALITVVGREGWASRKASAITHEAGLSSGSFYSRFDTVEELANDAWDHTLFPEFEARYEALMVAAKAGDTHTFAPLLRAWHADTGKLAVWGQLIVASMFDEELGDVIFRSVQRLFSQHCVPADDSEQARIQAAASTMVTAFACGIMVAALSGTQPAPVTDQQIAYLSTYHSAQPIQSAPHTERKISFTRHEHNNEVERSVIRTLGKLGYSKCTVARMARGAGMTKGALFYGFDDKSQLIAHAARSTILSPVEVWDQYQPVIDEFGPLDARAMFLRDFLDERHIAEWRVNLELARVTKYVDSLRDFKVPADGLQQTHLGIILVACIVPGISKLPYEAPFVIGSAT